MKAVWIGLGVPLLSIVAFLLVWGTPAPKVQTSLGAIPGPAAVWTEVKTLHADAQAKAAKEAKFLERVDARNEKLLADGKADQVKDIAFTGTPSYCDQI